MQSVSGSSEVKVPSTSQAPSQTNFSAFKKAQVQFRRRGDNPLEKVDSSVFDFSNPTTNGRISRFSLEHVKDGGDSNEKQAVYEGPLFGVDGYPGFVYAPQALSTKLQLELALLSVSHFCEPPHVTNIDDAERDIGNESTGRKEEKSMWKLWKEVPSRGRRGEQKKGERYTTKKRPQRKRNRNEEVPDSDPPRRRFDKLSWATMGYNYDWTARAYRDERQSPIPDKLGRIATMFAKTALLVDNGNTRSDSGPTFTPSACIVNYYNLKSIMGGHRDDLEYATDKPVVSLSMGLAGIFLLGGKTKEDNVVPILVRPGDVMMLGGDCRLNYHGMARVIPNEVQLVPPSSSLCPTGESVKVGTNVYLDEEELPFLLEFLKNHRININVRQVLPDGIPSISSLKKQMQR